MNLVSKTLSTSVEVEPQSTTRDYLQSVEPQSTTRDYLQSVLSSQQHSPIRIYTPRAPDEIPQDLLGNVWWQGEEESTLVEDQYILPQRFYSRLLNSSYVTTDVNEADIVYVPLEFRTRFARWSEYDTWLRAQAFFERKPIFMMWSHYEAAPPVEWRTHSLYAANEFHPDDGIRPAWDFVVPMVTADAPEFYDASRVFMNNRRNKTMFFRGANVRARPPFIEYFQGREGYTIETGMQNTWRGAQTQINYMEALLTHRFCLVGTGDSQIARRTYEAIACGCLPVLITIDHIVRPNNRPLLPVMILPFDPSFVNWESFAIIVPAEYPPESLHRYLENIPPSEVTRRQVNMERYRSAFIMNRSSSTDAYDMFDYIIGELTTRLPWIRERHDWKLFKQ